MLSVECVCVQSPKMRFSQGETAVAFLSQAQFHLDAVYWHAGVPSELAQVGVFACVKEREKAMRATTAAHDSFARLLRGIEQRTFDQLCAFEPANPFAKAYFLDVGDSVERLFQVQRRHRGGVVSLLSPPSRLLHSGVYVDNG